MPVLIADLQVLAHLQQLVTFTEQPLALPQTSGSPVPAPQAVSTHDGRVRFAHHRTSDSHNTWTTSQGSGHGGQSSAPLLP